MTAEEQAAALYEKLKLHAEDIEDHGLNLQLITAALTAYADEAVKRERDRLELEFEQWRKVGKMQLELGKLTEEQFKLGDGIIDTCIAAIREPSHG